MRKFKQTSLLILFLLTAVMSYADDITYISTSHGTYSGELANMTDGNTSTYWWSSDAQSAGSYVLITFSAAVDLTSFSTYSSSSTDYPASCNELQVSSDNTTWTTIGTFQDSQTSTFSDFSKANNILYVRIYATSNDTHWLYINEITMSYTAARHSITCEQSTGGTVTASHTAANKNDIVTLTVTPDTDYELSTLSVTDANSTSVETKKKDDGTYTFTMPASDVTVSVSFKELTQVDKSYSRSDVKINTWESFCLSMNVDIDELNNYFDEIYIPYKGETFDIYDDLDDATSSSAKQYSAARRTSADGTVTSVTASTESYTEEDAYWTSAEEKEATRYCFAYSAPESKYYHFFLADFSAESGIIIPQGTPFFAHLKSSATLTDNTLTLNGYLWSNETEKTGIVEKSFKVYSDQNLTTVDTDKSFDTIGELTENATFSVTGTLYAINTDGSFSATTDAMQQNHAYLMVGSNDAEGIIIYSKTESELLALTQIKVADPDDSKTLDLTDAMPTLTSGTYKAGNVTYARTGSYIVDGNYSSFCLPFDFNAADVSCFNKVYVPIHVAFYNTSTELLQIFLVNQTGIIKAGTPFLARLTGEAVKLTNYSQVTYTGTAANPDEVEITVFNNNGSSSVLTSNESIKLYWGGTLTLTSAKDGMNTFNLNGSFGPSSSNLNPFRAYLVETMLNTSAKVNCMEVSFIDSADELTNIENRAIEEIANVIVYNLYGMKVRESVSAKNALEGLGPGLYIVNGKKITKK